MSPFDLIDEAGELHEGLLDFLVAIEPFVARFRADIGVPAVRQFFGGVVHAHIFAIEGDIISDAGFDKVAGGVAFVLAAGNSGVPVAAAVEGEAGLQIAVRLLGGEDDRNPTVERQL